MLREMARSMWELGALSLFVAMIFTVVACYLGG